MDEIMKAKITLELAAIKKLEGRIDALKIEQTKLRQRAEQKAEKASQLGKKIDRHEARIKALDPNSEYDYDRQD